MAVLPYKKLGVEKLFVGERWLTNSSWAVPRRAWKLPGVAEATAEALSQEKEAFLEELAGAPTAAAVRIPRSWLSAFVERKELSPVTLTVVPDGRWTICRLDDKQSCGGRALEVFPRPSRTLAIRFDAHAVSVLSHGRAVNLAVVRLERKGLFLRRALITPLSAV